MKKFKKLVRFVLLVASFLVALILGVNFWVITSTESQVYYLVDTIPENSVGLILGTSKRTVDGVPNKYFLERISAAAELYHHHKVEHLIVSGDNRTVYYNEPRDMYQALIDLDVPKGAITLDFAGLRTLDSIVRADSIFGQKKFTIITQRFHCYRSLFIANFKGLDVIAYAANNKESLSSNLAFREVFARFAAVLDLYVWYKAPAILGEKELLEF